MSIQVGNNLAQWVSSQTNVKKGDLVKITATGTMKFQNSANSIGPDGVKNPQGQTVLPPDEHFVAPKLPLHSLIGIISDNVPLVPLKTGTAFLVGTGAEFIAEANGMVYLIANDNNTHFHDNSGTFDVTVEVTTPDLLAYYPLRDGPKDESGKTGDMVNGANVGFKGKDGAYLNGRLTDAIITPYISKFNFNNFSISVGFKVDALLDQPVVMGGDAYRWMGFWLTQTGNVRMKYNNSNFTDCSAGLKYQSGVWHTAVLTYNGAVGSLYLDSTLGGSTQFSIVHGNNKQVLFQDMSRGAAFKGYVRDLRIYGSVI